MTLFYYAYIVLAHLVLLQILWRGYVNWRCQQKGHIWDARFNHYFSCRRCGHVVYRP